MPDILEIPVDKAKSVVDLADWFELNELQHKKHPSLTLPIAKELPLLAVTGLVMVVGMALALLEYKGILKVRIKKSTGSREDFLDLINNSKTEKKLEQLIKSRYDLDLNLKAKASFVSEPIVQYGLDDAFARDWHVMSTTLYANAYGEDEPDYDNYLAGEPNPDYKP